MIADGPKVAHAFLTSRTTGLVELDRDLPADVSPSLELSLAADKNELVSVRQLPPQQFGLESGYFMARGRITFLLDPEHYPWLRNGDIRLFLGGEFNGWSPWEDPSHWELKATRIAERTVFAVTFADPAPFLAGAVQFKFITEERDWLSPPDLAPNRSQNDLWNTNLVVDPARTGYHRFSFSTRQEVDLAEEVFVVWRHEGQEDRLLLMPGEFFYQLRSDLPLGALVGNGRTTFRVFAPRARRVRLVYFRRLDPGRPEHEVELAKNEDGTWEAMVERDLHGWFYWFFFDGASNRSVQFQPELPVVDPYATALVCREGPGIILDRERVAGGNQPPFQPPPWQDLVIAELHVRDAVARAPLPLSERDRLGFTGLRKWVRSRGCYLKKLGVNAVELQPIQEFDNQTVDEYHWGYMPVNYFAPESSYSRRPEKASQVTEFRDVVQAFHAEGMSVILDVVYNHVGIPNHLLLIDKQYYFELDAGGHLMNWSGCGNDLRANAAMARRLILDSLVHLVEMYDVDGFRFDLAELLGVETLLEIEKRLKAVKPGIILIAEPWSFRGHIGRKMRDTGFSSWNDGFREFLRQFSQGHGNHEAIQFFLSGSPGALTAWPAQTVNYVESHDDRTWIDRITENDGCNGFHPTGDDRRRTHLMAAFLFSALGIPMLSAGQDFLRSKHGVNNTYQRGDLNALDYGRLKQFRSSHEYFAGWISLRRSERGLLFRLWEHPTNSYLDFVFAEHSNAFGVIFNADRSQGNRRLLLALNPHDHEVVIPVAERGNAVWKQLADTETVRPEGLPEPFYRGGETLHLPRLTCGLWEAQD
jgi:pullulanase